MKIIMTVPLKQAHNDDTGILLQREWETGNQPFQSTRHLWFFFSTLLSCVVRFVFILLHVEHVWFYRAKVQQTGIVILSFQECLPYWTWIAKSKKYKRGLAKRKKLKLREDRDWDCSRSFVVSGDSKLEKEVSLHKQECWMWFLFKMPSNPVSIFMWWQDDVVLPEASEAKKSTVPRGVKKGQKTPESCAVNDNDRYTRSKPLSLLTRSTAELFFARVE
jgi:hypothetical protein